MPCFLCAFNRLTNASYNDVNRYTYEYGANGQVAVITDAGVARKSVIEYDLAERPLQRTISRTNNGELMYRTVLKYIENNSRDFVQHTSGNHVNRIWKT